MRAGARPVFADLDPATLNVVAGGGGARRSRRARRALLPVHLYGHPADLDPLLDAGARARHRAWSRTPARPSARATRAGAVGALSGIGALSFYPTKNLGALGDGGAVVVQDAEVAARLRRLRNGGQSDRYRHEVAGINSRLDEMQAAILRVEARATSRRGRSGAARSPPATARGLDGAPASSCPREQPYARARLPPVRRAPPAARRAGRRARASAGVGTLVHYPIPLHLQPAFAGLGRAGRFPGGGEGGGRDPVAAPLPRDDRRAGGRGDRGRARRWRARYPEHRAGRAGRAVRRSSCSSPPALLWLALLRREDREALAMDEALFLALGDRASPSSAWVGLVLAEAGAFSLVTRRGRVIAVACAARPRPRPPARERAPGAAWARAPHAWARWPSPSCASPSRRGPASTCSGGATPASTWRRWRCIARTGGIAYVDPAVLSIPAEDVELFYRHPERPDYSWGRFMGFPLERPQTGRVVPEFFHLFPAFGAYLFQAMGVRGALATPCVFGVLGTLAALLRAAAASSAPRRRCWARCSWR